MEYVRFAVRFTAFALLVAIVGGYIVLVYRGDIPAPNLQAIANQVAPSFAAGGSIIVVAGIVVCCVLTAIAPFIYAARSGDLFTIIVSIVQLVVFFALMTGSRTVIDVVLAAIVYFTSALLSVVMYSTNRIVETVKKSSEAHLR